SIYQALGNIWSFGFEPDWNVRQEGQVVKRIDVPTYAFDRNASWVRPTNGQIQAETPLMNTVLPITNEPHFTQEKQHMARKESLIEQVKSILEDASGIEIGANEYHIYFIELGMDSLLLTQVALALKKTFSLPITFRGLNEA